MAAFLAQARWCRTARAAQLTPQGDWRVWLILAGRGWGKTRTGAEDIAAYCLWNENVRVAVVAPTFSDARDVCVEGESGLLRVLPTMCVKAWHRSTGDIILFNGSRIKLFSADQPDRLRGPQHHRVWCDELAAWPNREAFDQIWFGLRLGQDPRVIVTTTPRNTELMRELVARKDQDVHVTHGRTMDNADHLAPAVLDQLKRRYAGTRLGRQELEAEMLQDHEGALWNHGMIDKHRVQEAPELERIIVAIDPALTSKEGSDETGIVAVGRGVDGFYYVLADWSGRYTPEVWAKRAMMLYEEVGASMIVAEINAGGALVERILRQVDRAVPFKPVRALRGKTERALPVAALYEQGRVAHVGSLKKLEDQMCSFVMDSPGSKHGKSPDRVDAMVWGLTELSQQTRGTPRVRTI